jgi:hypothetical protein
MLSLGACLGTLTTAVDWTSYAEALDIETHSLIFGVLFIVSFVCLVVTLVAAKEPVPASIASSASCSYGSSISHSIVGGSITISVCKDSYIRPLYLEKNHL